MLCFNVYVYLFYDYYHYQMAHFGGRFVSRFLPIHSLAQLSSVYKTGYKKYYLEFMYYLEHFEYYNINLSS